MLRRLALANIYSAMFGIFISLNSFAVSETRKTDNYIFPLSAENVLLQNCVLRSPTGGGASDDR